jgi:hypothetical protein
MNSTRTSSEIASSKGGATSSEIELIIEDMESTYNRDRPLLDIKALSKAEVDKLPSTTRLDGQTYLKHEQVRNYH